MQYKYKYNKNCYKVIKLKNAHIFDCLKMSMGEVNFLLYHCILLYQPLATSSVLLSTTVQSYVLWLTECIWCMSKNELGVRIIKGKKKK